MKLALIGPGQLGKIVFHAAAGERLVVCKTLSSAKEISDQAELGLTTEIKEAGQCQIAAVTVPASVCPGVLEALCSHMKAGSIILNFATGWEIPDSLRQRYPGLFLLEAKMIGSAMGMAQNLSSMVILDCKREDLVCRVRDGLPGLNIVPGDSRLVKEINTLGTKMALLSALHTENLLKARGVPDEIIQTAVGGLMPGVLISYSQGTLGEFARNLEADLRRNMERKKAADPIPLDIP